MKVVIKVSEYERKKEILTRYIFLQKRICGYGEELAKWTSIGTKINQSYHEGIGTVSNDSKPEISGINLAEIKKKIIKDIEYCVIERNKIKNAIDTAPKRYSDVLIFRYVNGMKTREIAGIMNKDERSVRRIIKDATLSVKI